MDLIPIVFLASQVVRRTCVRIRNVLSPYSLSTERRPTVKRAFSALIIFCGFLYLPGSSVHAATPTSGTLSPSPSGGVSALTWQGGPYTAVTADPSVCTPLSCDDYYLTVNVPATYYSTNPDYSVRVHVSWSSLPNDFDLYVYDSTGTLMSSSAQGNTTFEEVDLGQVTSGTYHVQVVAFSTVNESYSGTVSLSAVTGRYRLAKYRKGNFTFTSPTLLQGPGGVVTGIQDLEPRSAFDTAGNIYVAAIEGVPAGTDVWKSTDGGTTFTYLGQPDGAQAAAATAGRLPGAGGGDEDIAVTSSARVCVASLWLGSVTMSSSPDGGHVWAANPVSSDVPADDRQWIATHGSNEVYLTFKQLGVLLTGTESIFVLKSFDGGLTFPQVTEATTPEFGVQPGDQGNIAVDLLSGNVYTVFIGSTGNNVYLARSKDGGLSFNILPVYSGPIGVSYANVFPILAIDRGGNVHVVFSDGASIYLTSSQDQGTTWNLPVRVSNGLDTKTSLAPWVDAGDPGSVDIMWWGTSSSNNLAPDAQWKVIFAQTRNAFDKTPALRQSEATGVFHTGPICVDGTGCASGTRDLAEYASTTIYRDGMAMIVYPDNQHQSNPLTYFVKQNGGSGVFQQSKPSIATNGRGALTRVPPRQLVLEQNYPNPFNPTTAIGYQLPTASQVTLKVFDLLGRVVATLVNDEQPAGSYSVAWDASHLSSGVYFYRLQAGNLVQTRRLVVVK